ncbi:MAG: hypothetical protein JW981_06955 [Anaerolineae bacterium]|nr:hypothetical protein [Anaerolineae bacterium]
MTYFFLLLFYLGVIGGAVLLVIELIPRLHSLRNPLSAILLTLMTLVWVGLPAEGRWMLSLWSPTAVMGGQILLDMTPAVWWCGLALGLALSGAVWVEVANRSSSMALSGVLLYVGLLAIWLVLASGSLLTTLAGWAFFDLLWGVSGMMVGGDGQRVTLALGLRGTASLLLWAVSLLLEQEGASVLWWLMWPSEPVLTLLLIAALIRVGFYPFQIVFPQHTGTSSSLTLIHLLGPALGLSLIYRLLALPAAGPLPTWCVWWGIVSAIFGGLAAWTSDGRRSLLAGGYGILTLCVTSAFLAGSADAILQILAITIAAASLVIFSRGYDPQAKMWSWPAWMALFFLLGVPPSPVGTMFMTALDALSWGGRLLLFCAGTFIGASLLRGFVIPAKGRLTPPSSWQVACWICGLLLLVIALGVVPVGFGLGTFTWLGWTLWLLIMVVAGALAHWGLASREWLRRFEPVLGLLDLQWFYSALWRGAGHALGVLRVGAEVFEGSGALMWSFLVLLLIVFVVVNQ